MRKLMLFVAAVCVVTTSAGQEPPLTKRSRAMREAVTAVDRAAIEKGEVKAVVAPGTAPVVVTDANLEQLVEQGKSFVQDARSANQVVQLPAILRTNALPGRAEQAVLLTQEITIPSATPKRVQAFVNVGNGLVFNGERRRYKGRIYVALANVNDEADQSALLPPVSIAFSGVGAEIKPAALIRIDRLRDWRDVDLEVLEPSMPYHIAATADPSEQGKPVKLEVLKPKLSLVARESPIFGWGLASTEILVKVDGLEAPEGYGVPLATIGGELDEQSVVLSEQGMGSIRLRSGAQSNAVVSAIGSPFEGAPSATITFTSPLPFFALAAGGGIAGAFVRGKGRKRWGRALAIGLVTGVIMAVAYAVGIDWVERLLGPHAIRGYGYALVAVLGAIGAIAGVTFLVPADDGK